MIAMIIHWVHVFITLMKSWLICKSTWRLDIDNPWRQSLVRLLMRSSTLKLLGSHWFLSNKTEQVYSAMLPLKLIKDKATCLETSANWVVIQHCSRTATSIMLHSLTFSKAETAICQLLCRTMNRMPVRRWSPLFLTTCSYQTIKFHHSTTKKKARALRAHKKKARDQVAYLLMPIPLHNSIPRMKIKT